MVFIVANHYAWHGGSAVTGTNFRLAFLLGNYAQIGVALFVMLGSWFLTEKTFSATRVFNLWKQVFFYSVAFTLLVKLLIPDRCSLFQLGTCIFPIIFSKYWFVVPYVFLLFLHPYINHILNACTKQQLRAITFFLLLTISIIPTMFIIVEPFNYMIFKFILYYVIAYGIRNGAIKINITKPWLCIVLSLLISLTSYFFSQILLGTQASRYAYEWANNTASIPILGSTVLLFVGMSKIKFTSRIINYIASSTFAVYLISEHPILYTWAWTEWLHVDNLFNVGYYEYVLYSIAIILLVFIVCIAIDKFIKATIYKLIEKVKLPDKVVLYMDSTFNIK